MKKIIFSLIMISVVGCGTGAISTNPQVQMMLQEGQRIQAEYELILQDFNDVQNQYNELAIEQVNFIDTLNDEQLKLYEEYVSSETIEQKVIRDKRLRRILSEEQIEEHLNIAKKRLELDAQTQDIQNGYQLLLQQDKTNRQLAQTLYESLIRQQQAQQQAWQNFSQNFWQNYQQQRMYNAQYNYYTRPYKMGGVTYIPARP